MDDSSGGGDTKSQKVQKPLENNSSNSVTNSENNINDQENNSLNLVSSNIEAPKIGSSITGQSSSRNASSETTTTSTT